MEIVFETLFNSEYYTIYRGSWQAGVCPESSVQANLRSENHGNCQMSKDRKGVLGVEAENR